MACDRKDYLKETIQQVLVTQKTVPPPLSAKDKASFAYKTINDRLPAILGKTIDFIDSNKQNLYKFGSPTTKPSEDEIKEMASEAERVTRDLRGLRKEIETNTPARPFEKLPLDAEHEFHNDDIEIWNETLDANRHEDGQRPRYYEASWLLAECYVYRRVKEILLRTKHLKSFDPFVEQKQAACRSSLSQMIIVSNHLQLVKKTILESDNLLHPSEMDELSLFMQLALWANKSDLSLSGMSASGVQSNELLVNIKESLDALRESILCNDMPKVWSRFQTIKRQTHAHADKRIYIDLVADNSGYEIFVDLCLMHCLTLMLCPKDPQTSNFRFRFHLKRMPWFVSDTMRVDIDWLLNYMSEQNPVLMKMAEEWRSYLKTKLWELHDHKFWTLPHDFSEMPRLAKDLYATLQGSSLIIFKGDLNYRKLTGDRSWHVLTPFHIALREFRPAPLVTLRTMKADTVVGISDADVYTKIEDKQMPENWLISGNYGLIQYFEPSN